MLRKMSKGKKITTIIFAFYKQLKIKHCIFTLQHMQRGNKEKMRLIIKSFYSSLKVVSFHKFKS